MFREIFLGVEKIFSRKVIFFHAALVLASVLFLYFFSISTSPRYSTFGVDSAIFQAVGKCWTEGLLPYVGTFENKGPLLFAINALGYLIYPRVGIFLLQIPFMYFSFLFTWRAVELYWSRRATLIIWLLTFFWRFSFFYEGNRTEEYSMPFLLAATYFFLRWLKEEKNFLPPIIGFIYGLGFGACVLLRTTNGLPICCYVLLSTIFLIHAGAFKNIWQNFLSFWAGFVAICLPFMIYFAAHGALYDMIYGTILINITHVTSYNSNLQEFSDIINCFKRFNVLFWIIAVALFVLVFKRKDKLAWSGLFTSAAMLFMLMKSRPFRGYSELTASMLPILSAVLYELKTFLSPTLKKIWANRAFSVKRLFCKVAFLILVVLLFFNIEIPSRRFISEILFWNSEAGQEFIQNQKNDLIRLKKNIPVDERNSVVMWSDSIPMSTFILETGIHPRCRFFGNIESFFGKHDPAVTNEWIQNVCDDYPRWIVYGPLEEEYSGKEMDNFSYNFRRQRNSRVEKILNDKYTLTDEMELYGWIIKLYRLDKKETY